MALELRTPGVYREETFVRAPAPVPTGVPGFIGFGQTGTNGDPEVLQHIDQLAERWTPPETGTSYLAAAVEGFFSNGGTRCYVVGAGAPTAGADGLKAAIAKLGDASDIDLLAVPDAMTLSSSSTDAQHVQHVQQAALVECTRLGNRFAILDAPRVSNAAGNVAQTLTGWRDAIVQGSAEPVNRANAALYFPWVWTVGGTGPIPPCGHVAGIIARCDATVGVFKAPANEELRGVVNLDFVIDDETQGELNPLGINCLRAQRGRGLRVFGARTLSADPQWRYVNVRRLVLAVVRWTERNLAWVPFEPNTPRLWVRIQRELTVYLEGLWRAGALRGATAGEAFFVRCDAETNPPQTREQGHVVTEVGVAAASPAEFIVVHIIQRPGISQLG